MDEAVTSTLARSGSNASLPPLVIIRDAAGKIIAPREGVQVQIGEGCETLSLAPIRQLFAGDRKPGDLSDGPTPELEPFFMLLEYTIVRFCDATVATRPTRRWSASSRRCAGVPTARAAGCTAT
jgi:hypothetical protein